jgi:hypothetical protein
MPKPNATIYSITTNPNAPTTAATAAPSSSLKPLAALALALALSLASSLESTLLNVVGLLVAAVERVLLVEVV